MLCSDDRSAAAVRSLPCAQDSLTVLQQRWIVEWRSTPGFETAQRSDLPLLVLISGLAARWCSPRFVTSPMVRTAFATDEGLESLRRSRAAVDRLHRVGLCRRCALSGARRSRGTLSCRASWLSAQLRSGCSSRPEAQSETLRPPAHGPPLDRSQRHAGRPVAAGRSQSRQSARRRARRRMDRLRRITCAGSSRSAATKRCVGLNVVRRSRARGGRFAVRRWRRTRACSPHRSGSGAGLSRLHRVFAGSAQRAVRRLSRPAVFSIDEFFTVGAEPEAAERLRHQPSGPAAAICSRTRCRPNRATRPSRTTSTPSR